MPADFSQLPSDAQLLYDYLGQQIGSGDEHRPAGEVLADLHAYSLQLERLRGMVREAENSLAQGKARDLDLAALLERVRQRAANEGQARR
jgi:hypothetical protein